MKTLETNLEEHMKYMGTQLAAILDKIVKKPEETDSGGNNVINVFLIRYSFKRIKVYTCFHLLSYNKISFQWCFNKYL
jgi:hypothetical protein